MKNRLQSIAQELKERSEKNLERSIASKLDNAERINLVSNDYLRLSQHSSLKQAAIETTERYGCSSSASPLLGGYTDVHRALENTLCKWIGFNHGLIWNTGYAANQAVLSLIPQKGDLILADRLVHNSMINGMLRSSARILRFQHNDIDHLKSLLEKHANSYENIYVATESVYSMDGDYPDLKAIASLKSEYNFSWILDEAHAIGWYGPGMAKQQGVIGQVDILVGTCGKALGSMGAFTLFHEESLRRFFINHANEFIYSTYLPPACAASTSAAVRLIQDHTKWPDEAKALSRNIRNSLKNIGWNVPNGDSPILPVLIVDNNDCIQIKNTLFEQGIDVAAIRPPTVPDGTARLRLSLYLGMPENEQERFLDKMKRVLP